MARATEGEEGLIFCLGIATWYFWDYWPYVLIGGVIWALISFLMWQTPAEKANQQMLYESAEILNVKVDASAKEIRNAYEMIKDHYPRRDPREDRGFDSYICDADEAFKYLMSHTEWKK